MPAQSTFKQKKQKLDLARVGSIPPLLQPRHLQPISRGKRGGGGGDLACGSMLGTLSANPAHLRMILEYFGNRQRVCLEH